MLGNYENYVEIEQKVINGSESEKKAAWQKFLKLASENESTDDSTKALITFLTRIVELGPETYKQKAWDELLQRGLTTYSNKCDVFRDIIAFGSPEPYKVLAWAELAKCREINPLEIYPGLIIKGIEPFSLWAWQNLENHLRSTENSDEEKLNRVILQILLYAGEPYKQWAWGKISTNRPDINVLVTLLIEWPHPEPYAGMAWALLNNIEPEKMGKQGTSLLKIIANESRTAYQLAALSKLLTLPLPPEDREIAERMFNAFVFVLEKEIHGEGYAITYPRFQIKKEDNEDVDK